MLYFQGSGRRLMPFLPTSGTPQNAAIVTWNAATLLDGVLSSLDRQTLPPQRVRCWSTVRR